MTDVEPVPATAGEIATTLAQGRTLVQRMANTHATVFQDAPGVRELYVDVFSTLLSEAENVPGYSTAMAMLIERYAFVWATQKAADIQDRPMNARDYDQLIQRFRQLWESMLKARDDRQADAKFRAEFITEFMNVFASTLDEFVSADQSVEIQRAVVSRMRARNVQGRERA